MLRLQLETSMLPMLEKFFCVTVTELRLMLEKTVLESARLKM